MAKSIIELLEKEGVLAIEVQDDNRLVELREACDYYNCTQLSKEQLLNLIDELTEIANDMLEE